MITSGLSSAVYGTDFGSSFSRSLLNTVVNLTLADVQFEIGELGNGLDNWEGSPGHMLLHGLAGCAAASASGSDCAAGAAGGVAQSLLAGIVSGRVPDQDAYETAEAYEQAFKEWRTAQIANARMVGGLAGYLFSGGEGENVGSASAISGSGIANNYLTHEQKGQFKNALLDCNGDEACIEETSQVFLELSLENNAALLDAIEAGDVEAIEDARAETVLDLVGLYGDPLTQALFGDSSALYAYIDTLEASEAVSRNGTEAPVRDVAIAALVEYYGLAVIFTVLKLLPIALLARPSSLKAALVKLVQEKPDQAKEPEALPKSLEVNGAVEMERGG